MSLNVIVTVLPIILYVGSFMESSISNNISDKIYQWVLQYEHHQKVYRNTLLYSITTYCLLKKSAQTETTLTDFPTKCSHILYETERKLMFFSFLFFYSLFYVDMQCSSRNLQ